MSIRDIQDDLINIIKPQIEEILKLLNNIHARDVTGNIEAAAAKIITELKPLIQDCHCKEEILQALQQQEPTGKQIVSKDDNSPAGRYSYPNFNVGNDNLGTGKNPGSLTWPFNDPEKSE